MTDTEQEQDVTDTEPELEITEGTRRRYFVVYLGGKLLQRKAKHVADRDPARAARLASADACGFFFFTRLHQAACDHRTGDTPKLRSDPYDRSGRFFIDGAVITDEKARRAEEGNQRSDFIDLINLTKAQEAFVERHGRPSQAVVRTRLGEFWPFDEGLGDRIVSLERTSAQIPAG